MALIVDDNEKYPGIAWDTPISNILREDFVLEDAWATNHITVEDALSHRSGLPRHDEAYCDEYDGHKATPKDVARKLRYLPMTEEPRTTWQYSNMMFITIAHVIHSLTGVTLGSFVTDNILKPLHINSTYFTSPDAHNSSSHFAQGYYYHENGTYIPVEDFDLELATGAGSVASNAVDYTKWLRLLINTTPLLSKTAYVVIKSPRVFLQQDPQGKASAIQTGPLSYALGWITGVYKGHQWFFHSGGMPGYSAFTMFFPELQYGIVAFGNTGSTAFSVEEILCRHLIDNKLRIPRGKRFDWQKKHEEARKKQIQRYNEAKSIYFHDAPSPPIPLSRPLDAYAATYFHPGYQNMTVFLDDDGKLQVDRNRAVLKLYLTLEHVSGEYFLADADTSFAPGGTSKNRFPAEFKIAKDGTVGWLGLAIEESMKGEKIWFGRIG